MGRRALGLILLASACGDGRAPAVGAPPSAPPSAPAPPSASAPAPPPSAAVPPRDPCLGASPGALAPHERALDADLEPTPESVERELRALAAAHPCRARIVELGRSHFARPLLALVIEDATVPARPRPSFLLTGATHGDEPLSTSVALDTARWMLSSDEGARRLAADARTWIVPLVNPDGLVVFRSLPKHWVRTGKKSPGRKNGRDHDGDGKLAIDEGVDLNRNFPFRWGALGEAGSTSGKYLRSYRGPSAGSEPETQALVALAQREVFAASLSLHVGTVAVLVPYTTDRVLDPKPNEAWAVAKGLSLALPQHPDVPRGQKVVVQRNLYTVDGTDQDHFRHEHGTLALLFEAALRGVEKGGRATQVLAAMRPALPWLERRLLDGPSVRGRVVGADGHPLEAEIRIDGVALRAKEHWVSRCRDGYFARYLEGTGRVTVVANLPDGKETSVSVDVSPGRGAEVELRLPVSGGLPRCAENR